MELFCNGIKIGEVTKINKTEKSQQEIQILPENFKMPMKLTYINKELIEQIEWEED